MYHGVLGITQLHNIPVQGNKKMAKINNETKDVTNVGMILLRHSVTKDYLPALHVDEYVQAFLDNITKPAFQEMIRKTPVFVESFFRLISDCRNTSLLRQLFNSIVHLHSINTPLSGARLFSLMIPHLGGSLQSESAQRMFDFINACLFRDRAILYFRDRLLEPENKLHQHLVDVYQLQLLEKCNYDINTVILTRLPELIEAIESDDIDVINKYPNSIYRAATTRVFVNYGTNSILWIDDDKLEAYATSFEQAICSRRAENLLLRDRANLTVEDVLEELQCYVDSIFSNEDNPIKQNKCDSIVEKHKHACKVYEDDTGQELYMVPLSSYIESDVVICIHRALFDAYLLDSLVKKGYMDGRVSLICELTAETGHAWVNFSSKQKDCHGPLINYLVDTYNCFTGVIDEDAILNENEFSITKHYGFKPLFRMMDEVGRYKPAKNPNGSKELFEQRTHIRNM